jgi:hypothetical protein
MNRRKITVSLARVRVDNGGNLLGGRSADQAVTAIAINSTLAAESNNRRTSKRPIAG